MFYHSRLEAQACFGIRLVYGVAQGYRNIGRHCQNPEVSQHDLGTVLFFRTFDR
jgi:hypothetical protein